MNPLWLVGLAVACNALATYFNVRRGRMLRDEYTRLRALNQIVWAYTGELLRMGVTLPPRCVVCCQILPRHVDGCLMENRIPMHEAQGARIKYYANGEHPPHPEEEDPPPARKAS